MLFSSVAKNRLSVSNTDDTHSVFSHIHNHYQSSVIFNNSALGIDASDPVTDEVFNNSDFGKKLQESMPSVQFDSNFNEEGVFKVTMDEKDIRAFRDAELDFINRKPTTELGDYFAKSPVGSWTRSTPSTKPSPLIIEAVGSYKKRLAEDQVIGAIYSLEIGNDCVVAAFCKGHRDSEKIIYGIGMLTASYIPNEILPQEDQGKWTRIRFEGRSAEVIKSRFEALNTTIANQPKQREL